MKRLVFILCLFMCNIMFAQDKVEVIYNDSINRIEIYDNMGNKQLDVQKTEFEEFVSNNKIVFYFYANNICYFVSLYDRNNKLIQQYRYNI